MEKRYKMIDIEVCEKCGRGLAQTKEIKWLDDDKRFSANVCQECYKELKTMIENEDNLKLRETKENPQLKLEE